MQQRAKGGQQGGIACGIGDVWVRRSVFEYRLDDLALLALTREMEGCLAHRMESRVDVVVRNCFPERGRDVARRHPPFADPAGEERMGENLLARSRPFFGIRLE